MHVVSRCRINSGGDSNSEKSSEGNSFGSSDPKSDADLHTDFSFFDHKESMQIGKSKKNACLMKFQVIYIHTLYF